MALKSYPQTSVRSSTHTNMLCWRATLDRATWLARTLCWWQFLLSCQSSLLTGYLREDWNCQAVQYHECVSPLLLVVRFLFNPQRRTALFIIAATYYLSCNSCEHSMWVLTKLHHCQDVKNNMESKTLTGHTLWNRVQFWEYVLTLHWEDINQA